MYSPSQHSSHHIQPCMCSKVALSMMTMNTLHMFPLWSLYSSAADCGSSILEKRKRTSTHTHKKKKTESKKREKRGVKNHQSRPLLLLSPSTMRRNTTGQEFHYHHIKVRKAVGFIFAPDLSKAKPEFHEVDPRILHLTLHIGKEQLFFLSVYSPIDAAPSSETSAQNLLFYTHSQDHLEEKTLLASNRRQLLILGDFNCTLRQHHHNLPCIGQFALSLNNPLADAQKMNADLLVDLCCLFKLRIVNTLAKKKTTDLTTFQPTQKIVTQNPLERMFVKDLILTKRTGAEYTIIKCQTLRHTPHHL